MSTGADLARDLLALVNDLGHDVVLTSQSAEPAYNPETGIATGEATTDNTGQGLFMPYRAHEIDGTRIKADDRKCILAAQDLADVPETGDILTDIDSAKYRVMDVKTYRAQSTAVCYVIHSRRRG